MKLLVLLSLLITTSLMSSEKECYRELTNNFRDNSVNYSLGSADVIYRDFGNDYLADAIYHVRALLDKKGCARNDINFGRGSWGSSISKCYQMIRGKGNSRVCYVESNLGYFFITKDFLETVNITYNRWD